MPPHSVKKIAQPSAANELGLNLNFIISSTRRVPGIAFDLTATWRSTTLLKFGDGEADSADDAGRGRFVGGEPKHFDTGVERAGAEDEAIGLIAHIAKRKGVVGATA